MAVAGGDALRGVPYPIALLDSSGEQRMLCSLYGALAEEVFASYLHRRDIRPINR